MCIGLNRRVINNGASSSNGIVGNEALLNVWNAKQSNASPLTDSMDLTSLLRSSIAPASRKNTSTARKSIPKDGKRHITVQHNYHDHANDVEVERKHIPARGGVITPFPLKLHAMLEAVQREGLEHIVSWQPHGRCFVVRDSKAFVPILEKHFKVSKIASFQRQLNLYGFQRITKGRDRGGYYNELFLRGKVFLSQNIHRVKVKGTKIRARSNPDQEPNFYAMPFVGASAPQMVAAPAPVMTPNVFPPMQANPISFGSIDFEPVPLAQMRPAPWDLKAPPAPKVEVSLEPLPWDDVDENFLASEADDFFQDFDFQVNSTKFDGIEDDDVFGNLLEQIVDA